MTAQQRGNVTSGLGIGAGRLIVSAVVVPIVLALVGAGWMVWQVGRVSEANRRARESEQAVDLANDTQKLLLQQHTGLRGFLITSDASFLDLYEKAHLHEALDALEQRADGEGRALARVRTARAEYLAWEAAALRSIADPEGARRLPAMQQRQASLDRTLGLLEEFMALEDEKRGANYARVAREMKLALASAFVALTLLGIGAALVSLRQIRTIAASVAIERAALRAKDEFLATLSHELRTPLTPILGWAKLLRQKPASGEALDRALSVIERNALAEAQLIDDVLDTARIAGGKLTLAAEIVDLGAVAREAADVVRLSAEARGVALEVSVAPDAPAVLGDPRRLSQVVWNLVSNAVKFTPRGGHVQLEVTREDAKARIRVTDDGEGIRADMLPHLFERFWQADASPARRHGGLGLGLAIVKELVALHGGAVGAHSDGLGRGAVFTVTLPIAAVATGAASPRSEGAATPEAVLHGVHALVVDDDACTRDLVAAVLMARGADVQLAGSAGDALDLLGRGRFDVLISDLGMPGTCGYALIEKVRRTVDHRLPALALSAYAGADDVQKALRAGFSAHLAKPVAPDALVGAVARLLGGLAAAC
jgi:signal transduction histidine kinase/ActR/RegA family two-component response regulator